MGLDIGMIRVKFLKNLPFLFKFNDICIIKIIYIIREHFFFFLFAIYLFLETHSIKLNKRGPEYYTGSENDKPGPGQYNLKGALELCRNQVLIIIANMY